MNVSTTTTRGSDSARRVEELGRIIMAYSEITERLQQSHDQLTATVERLKQELSEKSRLLERRNRLAALGEMAAGIAHEIRNPLAGIQLYATMLSEDLADRPDSQATVEKIRGGVRRLEMLVGQVLQFSREINPQPVECDVVPLLVESLELARARTRSERVRVVLEHPQSLRACVDPQLLSQAMLNLLLNALEAVGGEGTVRVVLSGDDDDASGKRGLRLVVQDSGPGIDPDVLDRIFNPFFTTKDSGTGLGLSIVHRIVEAHDGSIHAGNVPGGGARFELRI
jgi:signal transduction histidine kinase